LRGGASVTFGKGIQVSDKKERGNAPKHSSREGQGPLAKNAKRRAEIVKGQITGESDTKGPPGLWQKAEDSKIARNGARRGERLARKIPGKEASAKTENTGICLSRDKRSRDEGLRWERWRKRGKK